MAEFPNYYSTTADFTLTTGGSVIKTFGLNASVVRIVNRSAASLWVNPRNVAATTNDMEVLSSGELLLQNMPPSAGVGLFHPNFSTTTTGTAMEAGIAAIAALRSV